MDGFPDLPNEIVTDIFLLCLPEGDEPYQSTDPRVAPFLLMHVCSSWRSFALELARLWHGLRFEVPFGQDIHSLERYLLEFQQQLDLWDQHCRDRPMDLRFHLFSPGTVNREIPTQSNFWHKFVCSTIHDHLPYLRRLHLQLNVHEDAQPIYEYNLSGSCFPALESVALILGSHSKNRNVRVTFLSQAFSLRRAYIALSTSVEDGIPLRQLTHLMIDNAPTRGGSVSQFYFLAKECSLLEDFSMKIAEHDMNKPPPAPFTVPCLRTLNLTLCTHTTPTLFTPLNLPLLRHFALYSDTGNVPESFYWVPVTAAHDHLYQQIRNLRSLKLGFQFISSEMLLDILRSTPFLEELALDVSMTSYPTFLKGLTISSFPESQILPRLELFTLYVQICPLGNDLTRDLRFPFTNRQFLSMLCSRSKGATLEIDGLDIFQNAITRPLKRMRLIVEKTDRIHALDLRSLKREVLKHPELSDVELDFRFSFEQLSSLGEEIPVW